MKFIFETAAVAVLGLSGAANAAALPVHADVPSQPSSVAGLTTGSTLDRRGHDEEPEIPEIDGIKPKGADELQALSFAGQIYRQWANQVDNNHLQNPDVFVYYNSHGDPTYKPEVYFDRDADHTDWTIHVTFPDADQEAKMFSPDVDVTPPPYDDPIYQGSMDWYLKAKAEKEKKEAKEEKKKAKKHT